MEQNTKRRIASAPSGLVPAQGLTDFGARHAAHTLLVPEWRLIMSIFISQWG
jgi:hypothetical protein